MKNRCSECQGALHEARLAALPHTKTCSRRCDVRRCRRIEREAKAHWESWRKDQIERSMKSKNIDP